MLIRGSKKTLDQKAIRRQPPYIPKFILPQPPCIRRFLQLQMPLNNLCFKAVHRQVELRIVIFNCLNKLPDSDCCSQFFPNLSHECFLRGFSGLDLAAGEFPPTLVFTITSRSCEDLSRVVDRVTDYRCHNTDVFSHGSVWCETHLLPLSNTLSSQLAFCSFYISGSCPLIFIGQWSQLKERHRFLALRFLTAVICLGDLFNRIDFHNNITSFRVFRFLQGLGHASTDTCHRSIRAAACYPPRNHSPSSVNCPPAHR